VELIPAFITAPPVGWFFDVVVADVVGEDDFSLGFTFFLKYAL
jgi:hypothetical protein